MATVESAVPAGRCEACKQPKDCTHPSLCEHCASVIDQDTLRLLEDQYWSGEEPG
jgi:hypothetical protein